MSEGQKVKSDNNEITEVKEAKHLGLIRKAKNKLNIEDCLKIGRQTTYVLLGSDHHVSHNITKNLETVRHPKITILNRDNDIQKRIYKI